MKLTRRTIFLTAAAAMIAPMGAFAQDLSRDIRLGPSAEFYFVKSLESHGDLTIFFTKSWIAMGLWILIAGSVAGSVMLARRNKRMAQGSSALSALAVACLPLK